MFSPFNLDNIDISQEVDFKHGNDYVYFDSDMRDLVKSLRSVFDIFNRMFKRWSRFDTVSVSKSVFDYKQRVSNYLLHCADNYRFVYGDTIVSITHSVEPGTSVKSFIVQLCNFPLDKLPHRFESYQFALVNNIPSSRLFRRFSEALPCFFDVVEYIIEHVKLSEEFSPYELY